MPAREGEPYIIFFIIIENIILLFEFRAKVTHPFARFVTLLVCYLVTLSKPPRHLRPIYIIV